MKKAGTVWAAVTLAVGLTAGVAGAATAQEMKEESVKTFMEYAWQLTPAQFTKPSGEVVQIDKKKKAEVMVPVDTAREVIKVGRLSAYAQVCELKEDQVDNYRSLMYREEDKKKWSPQQMIYLSQLHLTTVMMLTGKMKLVEKDGDKEVVVEEIPSKVAQTCTDEQRNLVKERIAAYIATGPKMVAPPAPSAAPAAAAPAGAAAPAPAAAAAKQ